MPTIQQQLNQLKKDKETLNTMLNTMGVETTGNETFTQLTPLVGKIVTDPILQDKSVTITENSTLTIQADEGYDGLNNVDVNVNVSNGSDVLYTLLESIETQKTFGQYLNTNYKINNNTRIVIKFSRDVNIQGGSMFGVFQDEGATSMFAYHSNGTHKNRFELYYGNPVQVALIDDTGKYKNNTDFIIDANKNTWTLYDFDGNVIGSKSFQAVEFETPYTTPIMASRVRSTDINQYGYSKLYYCQIYDNDELLYDIVPAIDLNGVVCCYNKVDNTFMYNQGTGEFIAGKVIRVVKDKLQDKSVEITENGTTTIIADENYDGLNSVEVTTNISGGDEEMVEYSTTEQVIGTWIDGKPLYRKVIQIATLPNNTTVRIPHGIENADRYITKRANWYDTEDYNWKFDFREDSSTVYIYFDVKTTEVEIHGKGTNWAARTRDCTVILEYTKTTDTAL